MDRAEFKTTAEMLAESARQVILTEIMRMFDNLTEEERKKFSLDGQLFRLARSILVATCPEKLESEFMVESIRPSIRAIRRIGGER